jgi:subtilisin-like proprotein convertase family protein
MTISIQPSSFVLAPGGSQQLDVEVSGAAQGQVNVWGFGEVVLTPDDSSVPMAQLPVAVLPTGSPSPELDSTVVDDALGNANGYAEPHEVITLAVDLSNTGTGDATNVLGTLSTTTPGITMLDDTASWVNLPVGTTQTSLNPHFRFEIDGAVPCGTLIDFQLDLSTSQGPFSIPFQQEVGLSEDPSGLYLSQDAPPIPDNDPVGVTSSILVNDSFDIQDIHVTVNITHPGIGDLEVDLTSPMGTTVRLHNGSGGNGDDIVTTYDLVTAPDGPGSMTDFDGEDVSGTWLLKVVDTAANNVGQLNNWSLDIDGVFSLTCDPVPCKVFAAASVFPDLVCGGISATVSDEGSFSVGEDCGGSMEFRFSSGGLIQDWSADPDVAVAPLVNTAYNVEVRDTATLADDNDIVVVNVLPQPEPAIVQTPAFLCVEGGSADLDAGPGFVFYSWKDDTETELSTSQVLSVGTAGCGRQYTVTVEALNACTNDATQMVDCMVCTPPEVSSVSSTVPLRMGIDAAGTIEFELLPEPDIVYNLYSAGTLAEINAGDWTYKFCDLADPAMGIWTPVSGDTVRWTPPYPVLIFEGFWVVVAERSGFEGSFGPRPQDADGLASSQSLGCL